MPTDSSWAANENLDVKPTVHVDGYTVRTLVPYGDILFDPHLADWVEEDGSVVVCDVGGQASASWDPDAGHGMIWRLRPDNSLQLAIPQEGMDRGPPFFPTLVPPSFGPWGGQALIMSQLRPGRPGARYDHVVHKWDRQRARTELFAILPRSATAIGGGVPAAPTVGAFGPVGSDYEGRFVFATMGNNTLYGLTPDGVAEVLAIFDGADFPNRKPRIVCFGGSAFSDHANELIIGFLAAGDAETGQHRNGASSRLDYHYLKDGRLNDRPIASGSRMLARPKACPAGFGPLSSSVIYADAGAAVQSMGFPIEQPLPHDATLFYRDRTGTIHPFVTGLRGGYIDAIFRSETSLVVSNFGKSYSSGEFHRPDGCIWEIEWTGANIPAGSSIAEQASRA